MKYTPPELGGQVVVLQYARYQEFVGKKCSIKRLTRTLLNQFTITNQETGRYYTVKDTDLIYAYTQEQNPEMFL